MDYYCGARGTQSSTKGAGRKEVEGEDGRMNAIKLQSYASDH